MNEAIIYNSLHLFILYSFFLEKKCKIRDYCRSSQIALNKITDFTPHVRNYLWATISFHVMIF